MIARNIIIVLSLAWVAAPALRAGEEKSEDNFAAAGFERIKGLAGEWVATGPDGQPTDKLVSVYRVTAAGTAVMETLFPGTEHEMVTMYHADRGELVLTHYCAAGNQPHMRARPGGAPNQLVFEFTGGTNITSEKDAHMHQATITFVDSEHLRAEWLHFQDGKPGHTAEFNLVRRKS